MPKANILIGIVAVVFLGYYTYTVFLAENALVKRTVATYDGKGGHTLVTTRLDGTKVIETYEVHDDGAPKSFALNSLGPEPGAQLKVMKPKSEFVRKHKKKT